MEESKILSVHTFLLQAAGGAEEEAGHPAQGPAHGRGGENHPAHCSTAPAPQTQVGLQAMR